MVICRAQSLNKRRQESSLTQRAGKIPARAEGIGIIVKYYSTPNQISFCWVLNVIGGSSDLPGTIVEYRTKQNHHHITTANSNRTQINGLLSPLPLRAIIIPHNALHNFPHPKNSPKNTLFLYERTHLDFSRSA